MKIAAITITYNDGYKFKEWCKWYEEYKDELDMHIIVDNHSESEYLQDVKKYFTDSIIIERETNGGCTGAYNDGIRKALENRNIEAIMLIGNDMRLETGSIKQLNSFLNGDARYGMVEPIILEKDSKINDFGCNISKELILKPYMSGKLIKDVNEEIHICQTVTGGMNLATRKFYEEVGLQDDNLFMYSDEVDMGLRAKKKGFLMAATKEAIAWHMHINESKKDRRHPFSRYLVARNKVYLGRKHFGWNKALYIFGYFIFDSLKGFVINTIRWKPVLLREYQWQMYGTMAGLLNNMRPNKFSRR